MAIKTEKPLVNRVANSGIINIDLGKDFPNQEFVDFDIVDYLFKGLILKEKDFRLALKAFDWTVYKDKIICVFCSNDAIIPMWAYMLIASYTQGIAFDVYNGTREEFLKIHYRKYIDHLDLKSFEDKRVIIKGCSDKDVPASAYLDLTSALKPYVKSLMFGEACSSVPIYKKPRKK